MNPYQMHAQNQFFAGLADYAKPVRIPLGLGETTCPLFRIPHSEFSISEASARAIVAAIDNNRPHKAALLIKELPWFAEVLSGVRNTRHLDPVSYIELSSSSSSCSSSN